MTQTVDWDLAASLGARVAGQGPVVSAAEAASVVAELRAGAARATGLVCDYTQLDAAPDTAPVLVVDRAAWVQANADAFATVIEPLARKLMERKDDPAGGGRPAMHPIGSKVTGAEVGLLLGFLGGKVLGQFDPFFEPAGRLLLVAPNIVHVERELRADPRDFRLWVCLHEETHRVQFTAVPWMREHIRGELAALLDTVEPTSLFGGGLSRIADVVRGEGSLLDLVGTPEQRQILDRVTGLMSLLEGHADVVMDGVGPAVIPSVARIRAAFDQRRGGVGVLDRVLRRLLGLEAKMAQYRDGAAFVRAVVDKAGIEGFNQVWAGPEQLPSKAEIHAPEAWVARVLA